MGRLLFVTEFLIENDMHHYFLEIWPFLSMMAIDILNKQGYSENAGC